MVVDFLFSKSDVNWEILGSNEIESRDLERLISKGGSWVVLIQEEFNQIKKALMVHKANQGTLLKTKKKSDA